MGSSEFKPEDRIDELFSGASPNSARANCPPPQKLIEVARRRGAIDDPVYQHLASCSDCYRDFRRIQQANPPARRRSPVLPWIAAAAVVLVTAVSARMFLFNHHGREIGQTNSRLELDLRPYALTRGAQRSDVPPLLLPRRYGTFAMLLPTGSEPGTYQVEVRDSRFATRVSATGDAKLENHVTTLPVTLDLGALPRGAYQLAIRRNGEEWQLFPAQAP